MVVCTKKPLTNSQPLISTQRGLNTFQIYFLRRLKRGEGRGSVENIVHFHKLRLFMIDFFLRIQRVLQN